MKLTWKMNLTSTMKPLSRCYWALRVYGARKLFIMIDNNYDNSGKQYMEQVCIVRQTLLNRALNEKIKKTVRGFS